jgi:hypothetical protein
LDPYVFFLNHHHYLWDYNCLHKLLISL